MEAQLQTPLDFIALTDHAEGFDNHLACTIPSSDAACTGSCEVLTIPHNTNYSWGLTFSRTDEDGTAYSSEDLEKRAKIERLFEITHLLMIGLQFLWHGGYYGQHGEYIESLEIPLAFFACFGGLLCLVAAWLTLVGRFLAPDRTPPSDGGNGLARKSIASGAVFFL